MDILMTLNRNYLYQMSVMLHSLKKSHSDTLLCIHLVSCDITLEDLIDFNIEGVEYQIYQYSNDSLDQAKITYRYPVDIYYRLYAITYLPKDIKRILYLDPDIIILKPLNRMYQLDFEDNYFIGATNISKVLTRFNQLRNSTQKASHYLNTGVLLMNLEKLREEQDIEVLTDYILKHRHRLLLPDQDVLHALYGDRTKLISHLQYNLSDRAILKHNLRIDKVYHIDRNWIDNHAYILHFYGKNKPWLKNYKGILKHYYDTFESNCKKQL